ncbi:MAG TPA: DMT family transporter [Terriglobales bacterium]|nr:DMT family transporter [Terriglobales bacterium]
MHELLAIVKNGILVAIVAQGLIGISLVWDKVLLKRKGTKNLFSYVFWLGAISIFGLLLIPFGYRSPSPSAIALAFLAGMADMIASFFYYAALKQGEASETLAVMGGFAPVATAAIGYGLLSKQMTGMQLIGFAIMCSGGFVMFFSEDLPLKKLLPMVLLAAGLFGMTNVLQKMAYDRTNFVSGYVWFTIGTFVTSCMLLVPPSWRKQIFTESGGDEPRNRFWYFVNRFVAGVGSFLVVYAISRTHPAMVSAISGVRYAVIFIGAWMLTRLKPDWLKETFRGPQLATKLAATGLVVAGLAIAGLAGSNTSAATAMLTPRTLAQPLRRGAPDAENIAAQSGAPYRLSYGFIQPALFPYFLNLQLDEQQDGSARQTRGDDRHSAAGVLRVLAVVRRRVLGARAGDWNYRDSGGNGRDGHH